MKRRVISLADINPKCLARNPHVWDASKQGSAAPNLPAVTSEGEKGVTAAIKAGKRRMEMNSTEREFSLMLGRWKAEGSIVSWSYEAMTLRWGVLDALKYSPDFLVVQSVEDGPNAPIIQVRFIEVKGPFIHNREAAMRRFKEARNHWHRLFTFEMWQRDKEHGWTQLF